MDVNKYRYIQTPIGFLNYLGYRSCLRCTMWGTVYNFRQNICWTIRTVSRWTALNSLNPFLAHLSRRLRGELLVYQWLRCPASVRQHFQTSSPLKPLGQLNSNFIWRLLRMGERMFVHMTKMAAMSIYGKKHLKIFSRTRRPMTLGLGM